MRILIPALTALPFASAATAGERPNIVYMLVDNWGWGDISFQGSSVRTPWIDSLAEQGMREYNALRPHSSLDYRPPAPETVQWLPIGGRDLQVGHT
jgi:hypothetical protein